MWYGSGRACVYVCCLLGGTFRETPIWIRCASRRYVGATKQDLAIYILIYIQWFWGFKFQTNLEGNQNPQKKENEKKKKKLKPKSGSGLLVGTLRLLSLT